METISESRLRFHRIFMWAWAAVSILFAVYLNFFGGKDLELDHLWQVWHSYYFGPWYATFLIVPVAMFTGNVARRWGGFTSQIGRAVWLLSIGGCLWGIGNFIWYYYNSCLAWGPLACGKGMDVPYPSWADAGYLALLPFAGVALWSLTRMFALTTKDFLKLWWIPVIAAIVTTYLTVPPQSLGPFHVVFKVFPFAGLSVWLLVRWLAFGKKAELGYFWFAIILALVPVSIGTSTFDLGPITFGKSYLIDPEGTFAANLISAIYIVSDVVLMSLAMILLVHSRHASGGVFFRPILGVTFAMAFMYIGDSFFFARVYNETFFNGDISDVLYGVSLFMIGYTVYLFSEAEWKMSRALAEPSTSVEGGE